MDVLELAQRLEQALGDPRDPAQLFSFARRVAEDEAEQYPAGGLKRLVHLELHKFDVPTTLGGELRSLDQLGALVRVVARRDLTVAIAHSISFLGSAVVWLAGNHEQRRALADAVLAGERVSVALTEEGSGSDLLGMTTLAEPVGHGYRLVGDKWLGNGFDHNRFAVVYARTSDRGGPRAYSLFLADKEAIPSGYRLLPRMATLGVRGADIRGIQFDAQLPAEALIGPEGSGFENTLRALQLSRTLCGELALGALDTSLETVLRFALGRNVYGKPVVALPQSKKLLSEIWAELLIADSLTGIALRGLQTEAGQASVHSSVVKYLVPTLAEQAMNKLSVVYGARHYLRNSHADGIFQKMYRDNLLIGLFDGSTQVNLYTLSQQLRALINNTAPAATPEWIVRSAPLPDFDWSALSPSAGGQSALFAAFDAGASSLRDRVETQAPTESRSWLVAPLTQLLRAKSETVDAVRQLSASVLASGDPLAFELARRYCVLTAASCVLAERHRNLAALGDTLAQPAVLAVVLQRLAAQLGDAALLPTKCYCDALTCLLTRRARDGQCGLFIAPAASSTVGAS